MANTVKKTIILSSILALLTAVQVFANNQSQFSQTISDSSKSIDIVDGSEASVSSPTVAFGAATFSYGSQNTTGTLGMATQKIHVSNPTSTATWTASIAGTAPSATWTSGSNTYNFNNASAGQMTVNPSGGTWTGVSSCSTANISLGSSNSFANGTTDSITLGSATTGTSTYCNWDLTNVALTQKIPAGQVSGSYNITMVLSII